MELNYSGLAWPAIITCVVVGQIFLTLWFLVLFGEPWAKAYGAEDKAQHAKEIPPYTYGIGFVCNLLLVVGLAALQNALGVKGAPAGLTVGVFVAVHFCLATAMPGYAFLKRWPAFFMAAGSQALLILIDSVILAVWA